MTPTPDDHLGAALRDLADEARPTDLYDRALHRSRRIARREAAVGTGAALLVLGVLGSGLWRLPDHHESRVPSTAVGSRAPAAAGPQPTGAPAPSRPEATVEPTPTDAPSPASRHRANRPQLSETTAAPRSKDLTDLPGHVFYQERGDEPAVLRLDPENGRTRTVLDDAPSPVGVSPDGSRIAYVDDGTLLVGRTTGDHADPVTSGVATVDQAPAWSPDGDRLLIHLAEPALLEVGTGTVTPLPASLDGGRHFRWSGDGSKLVYATSSCGLAVAGSDPWSSTAVPVVGDPAQAANPEGLAACAATSVDVTGRRVAVPLRTTGASTVAQVTADAVVDTATGDLVELPVAGTVLGAVFDPDGNLLVRAVHQGRTRLSLLAPDGTLLVRADEPAGLSDYDLLTYTR